MAGKHVVFKEQSAFATWVTPDTPMPVATMSLNPNVNKIQKALTGAGRGLYRQWNGSKKPEGALSIPFWTEKMGAFIKGLGFNDITSTVEGATSAYTHALHSLDTNAWITLSAQLQNDSEVYNVLGMAFGSGELVIALDDLVMLNLNYMARDEAKAGGTWDYDGSTASPAAIDMSATPYPFDATQRPFLFSDVQIKRGAVDSITEDGTSHQMTMGTPTTVTGIESLRINVDQGLELPVFLNNNRVPSNVGDGARRITVSFDLDQSDPDHDYYDEYRAGTQFALWVDLVGPEADTGVDYGLRVFLPLLEVTSAPPNEINGESARQTRSVECIALVDPTLERDCVIEITDTAMAY